MPRITEKQVHRENTPAATPYDYYDYYRVNVCSPFLEHLTEGIDQRFDECNLMTLRMMGLDSSISEAAEFYKGTCHALTYRSKSSEDGKKVEDRNTIE